MQTNHLLLETLIHVMIEKGLLSKNDALSIVQTVAQVKGGEIHDHSAPAEQTNADLGILRRMYSSFEALIDRSGAAQLNGANVRRLRPPLHGDRPEFPRDD
jgi:hypothetical protein